MTPGDIETPSPPRSLTFLACAVIAGTALGGALPLGIGWYLAGAMFFVGGCVFALREHWGAARILGLIAAALLIAAWASARVHTMSDHDIRRYVGEERQLARVRGVVDTAPRSEAGPVGALARFSFQPVSTTLTLDLDHVEVAGQFQPAAGRVFVTIQESDHRPTVGDRIEAAGWLESIDPPTNPGGFDFRAWAAAQGIHGRLTLPTRHNWSPLPARSPRDDLLRYRHELSERASRALRAGLEDQPRTTALLDALVLGRIQPQLADTRDLFREVGLSHLLAISGAHLGMLLMLAWIVGRGVFHHPVRANLCVLTVLVIYLALVPWRAPIVRAGLMAGVFCIGRLSGRRTPILELLSLACILRLLYQPAEIFAPGFQLSFGIVAALIVLVPRVSERLWPRPIDPPAQWSTAQWVMRRAAEYLAVNIVAFLVALPIAVGHFHMISPYGWLASLIAMPLTAAIIGLAFIKMLVTLIAPGAGMMLAFPLDWLSNMMLAIAQGVRTLPGSTVILRGQLGWLWSFATLTVILVALGGWFPRRRFTLAALALCIAWLAWHQSGRPLPWTDRPAMQVAMIAIGDGACVVVRTTDPRSHDDHILMFDCGGQGPGQLAQRIITPALRAIAIDHIDTLVISHADMDHFGAALDLIDDVPVGRVLLTPQFVRQASEQPGSAPAALLEGLNQRDTKIVSIHQGWNDHRAGATLDVLWPPRDQDFGHDNDSSIVLSIRAGGRRVLLTGDIEREAIDSLMTTGDLQADLCDLPHHGAFTASAQHWVQAVNPKWILQSCSSRRWQADPWRDFFTRSAAERYVTARDGMIQVRFSDAGEDDDVTVGTFLISEPPVNHGP